MRNAATGGVVTGGIASVALGAQAVLVAYIPSFFSQLPEGDVPVVANAIVAGSAILLGAAYRAGRGPTDA